MLQIDILTVLPELLGGTLEYSIVGRARAQHLVEIGVHWLRDYTHDKRRTVDDYAYGPDAGMVLKPEPIFEAVEHLSEVGGAYDEIIYTAPDGELLTQTLATELSLKKRLLILCGHYKGVDQRVRDHLVTREVSIGDYILSGGELAAAVIVDSVVRLVPGALSDATSALSDSFQEGLVAPPAYTRPESFRGWEVPEILRSGNFPAIAKWQHEESLRLTRERRPAMLEAYERRTSSPEQD